MKNSTESSKKNNDYLKALSFWTVALQFFTLVQNATRETIKQSNEWCVVTTNKQLTPDEYNKRTAWSDHQVIIPILFNFYHGMEVLLKGFLFLAPGYNLKPKHSIEHLSKQFVKYYPTETALCSFFEKYTQITTLPDMLKNFTSENSLSVGQLYEALRYPVDRTFNELRNYFNLKYQDSEGIKFFKDLNEDIEKARIAAVELGRTFKKCIEG